MSIVIVNHDGLRYLKRLLPALAATAYRSVDITVVGLASSDRSRDWLRARSLPFPIRVIASRTNLSFASAANMAVRSCPGELVLLLHHDVIPLEPGWLGYMVDSLLRSGAVAVGARLVFPRRTGPRGSPAEAPADLELQHLGISYRWVRGMPRPFIVGGGDPCADGNNAVRDVPAATAACLLVRRDSYLAVGGFDETYVDGYEDVDLAQRWRAAGERIVVDGRAVLWHDLSAIAPLDPFAGPRQLANQRAFYGRWGVELFREALGEALTGTARLVSGPPGLAVVGPSDAMEVDTLLDELGSLGWIVHGRDASLSDTGGPEVDDGVLLLVVDPAVDLPAVARRAVTIGWVRSDLSTWVGASWFDDLDLVIAPDSSIAAAITAASAQQAKVLTEPTAASLLALVGTWLAARRTVILVQASDAAEAEVSGDYHFARALQRQLERRGIPTAVRLRPMWADGIAMRDDVAVHLWGRHPAGPRPGQTMVLWILYHPELVTDALLASYDLVLAASDRFAAELERRTGRRIPAVHQATDPERFRPGLDAPPHELLFVGNSRGTRRRILDDLAGTERDLAVYGRGWSPDLLDPVYLRGNGVPNDRLAGYYANAAIVLNDHWPDAAAAGFINNRLYDALAAGAFVISDHVDGIVEEFDGAIVTYRDRDDLLRLIETYLSDADARRRHVERGRAAVLARHTFEHRAVVIIGLLAGLGAADR